jgi:hypothetical protein
MEHGPPVTIDDLDGRCQHVQQFWKAAIVIVVPGSHRFLECGFAASIQSVDTHALCDERVDERHAREHGSPVQGVVRVFIQRNLQILSRQREESWMIRKVLCALVEEQRHDELHLLLIFWCTGRRQRRKTARRVLGSAIDMWFERLIE